MKPDALKGVKHYTDEVLVEEHTLPPLSRWALPVSPRTINLEAVNSSYDDTYIIRVYRKEDSISLPILPKRKK